MVRGLHIVWFKRDLRVVDHAPLALALTEAAKHDGAVLPLYVVEPAYWTLPDTSARHYSFITESLKDLREDLASLGLRLHIRTGDMLEILSGFENTHQINGLYAHEETGNTWTFQRDLRVAAWCRERSIPFTEIPQTGVIRGLKDRNGWARHWDQFMAQPLSEIPNVSPPPCNLETGAQPGPHEIGLDASEARHPYQPGGRRAGLAALNSFLETRGERYRFEMSSPLTAEHACSRLSPHLAYGTVSMREIAQMTYQAQRRLKHSPNPESGGWRKSLASFSGRLHWHCHFMQKLEDQVSIETHTLHPAYEGLRGEDDALLAAWCKGETGLPFVDACMRMLQQTGWINFRMRAMLMAVASYHLWIDWRKPGEHLARLFTDYEPGIHWSQVQMQSGTTGINLPRIYNPVKQGYDQDPTGAFVRRWIPELAEVPDTFIQEPWTWEEAPTSLWDRYPKPVIDHKQAAKEARQKIWAVRSGDAYRDAAEAIQEKHGSRKSGISNRGQRQKRKAKNTDQMDLFAGAPK